MTNSQVIAKIRKENEGTLSPSDLDFLVYSFTRKLEFLEIETRACWADHEKDSTVNMAARVCREAIQKAGMEAKDIDLVLSTGCINPFREPSFANVVADMVGIDSADFFDINDTCNGFMKAFEISSMYINGGKYNRVLVFTVENPFEVIDSLGNNLQVSCVEDADYKMNVLFSGAGAAAMVLTADNGNMTVEEYYEKRSSKLWDVSMFMVPKFRLPDNRFNGRGQGTWSDGRVTSSAIIQGMPGFIQEGVDKLGISLESIKYIFMHQLGRNVTYSILNKLGVDREKVFPYNTFRQYGNMGSANIPVGFELAESNGLLKKGDQILLLSSSCGISYSLAHIVW